MMASMTTYPGLVPPRFANVDIELYLATNRELVRWIGGSSFVWYEVVAPQELPGFVGNAGCQGQAAVVNMEVDAYTCRARKAELFGDGRKLAIKGWEEWHEDTALESTWRSDR
jgi:hypothetical protein